MRRRLAATLMLALVLAGCAAPALAPAPAPAPGLAQAGGRLWYLGLGLFDASWSENDVAAMADRLRTQVEGFTVVPIVLSNGGGGRRLAAAERDTIRAALAGIGQRARPGDIVVLYVSTHGAPGELGVERAGEERAPVTAPELQAWLGALGTVPQVVILSACFSGSFIPAIAAENRIVFTAARADRTSFGCRAGAEHTYFGRALLDAAAAPHQTWRAITQQTRAEVQAMEQDAGIRRPSEPQLAVGAAMAGVFDQPAF